MCMGMFRFSACCSGPDTLLSVYLLAMKTNGKYFPEWKRKVINQNPNKQRRKEQKEFSLCNEQWPKQTDMGILWKQMEKQVHIKKLHHKNNISGHEQNYHDLCFWRSTTVFSSVVVYFIQTFTDSKTYQALSLYVIAWWTVCIPRVYLFHSVCMSVYTIIRQRIGSMNSGKRQERKKIAFAIFHYKKSVLFLKIKVKMCLCFFSRLMVLMFHPFTHSLTRFLYLLFAYISTATMAGEKRCNFTLTECKQNKTKQWQKLPFVRTCHYCLCYFCHLIASTLTASEPLPYRFPLHYGCCTVFFIICEEKAFSNDLLILHTYSIYYCCPDFSLFVKHFCTAFWIRSHMLKRTLLRLSFHLVFESHFSTTLVRIQSFDLAKLLW